MSYSPFRHTGSIFRKKDPVQVTFFLTRRCNAKCPFCFYLSRNGNGKESAELSTEEIEKVSRSMGNLLWLAFSGGEIFLRDDLAWITRIFYKHNKPAIILLPTNGLLPDRVREQTEKILKHCKKSTIVVKLSLDGPEEINDSLRGTDGAFRKTLETYRALENLSGKYRNFELGINTVFCSANQAYMDETIAFINGLDKIRTHTVSLIRGDVSDEHLKEVDIEKYRETTERMESDIRKGLTGRYRFRGARLKAAQDIIQHRLIYKTAGRKKRLIPCYAGRLNVVITETGDVYPCESFANKMGNVRESGYDMGRILKSKEAQEAIQSIKNNACFCTHECYMLTNILFNPAMYPALLREYMRIMDSPASA
ncbi:MAG TPA: radical SAM protein [Nitrospirae bacterium]|nr:radical SAM protein [Nitrospirota bacterium]